MDKSTIADDGTKLAYRVLGSGKRAVFFVHGWAVNGALWDDVVPAIDLENRRLIIPDLRGSGRSEKSKSGYAIERYAFDISTIAAAEGANHFDVVGHSMGGLIAQGVAATEPDRVKAMLLVTPVPASGLPIPDEVRAMFLQSAKSRTARAALLKHVTLIHDVIERVTALGDASSPEAISESFLAWSKGAYAAQLDRVRAKTLVLATDDPTLPVAMLREVVTMKIAGARLAHLPGAGHYPMLERPRETAAIIEAFLA